MKKILVIGESNLDVFNYCVSTRLAPDIPVPIVSVVHTKENAGMAMNVRNNIERLHGACDIITNQNWKEITKTRYVDEKTNHMFLRVDKTQEITELNIENLSLEYEIVVISDYNKGFIKEDDIKYICNKNRNVFLDSKKILGNWAMGARYIKINNFEYERSKNYVNKELQDKIIRTLGGDGCEFQGKRYEVDNSDVVDTSGAGDTFLASLVTQFLKTNDIEKSIEFANSIASKIVKLRGVNVP